MREEYSFRVEREDAEKRLDKFLYENIGAVSRMFLRDLIDAEKALVNAEAKPAGYHLRENDRVEISFEAAETSMTPEDIPLEILFEDAEILVVNKPAGMLVHPTKAVKTGTLANALAFHLNSKFQTQNSKFTRPGLVHRLDKDTSGLMVIAKTPRALRILSSHFERKLVKKIYLALVSEIVREDAGTINARIGRIDDEKPHWRALADGKEAETKFRVLERRTRSTLLELEPVTGRTNQLRIHCAHINHPIIGDKFYGGREFPRLCLHAARLGFFHPDGGWLEFSSELPADIKNVRLS